MFKPSTLSWALRLLAAVILGQTLFFKFTGAEESRYIFSTLGMEPWGRYGVGVAELITVGLLLYTPTAGLGSLLGLGVIAGALFFHLTILGIEVQGDGGTLFYLALTVFVCCLALAWLQRAEIRAVAARVFSK